MRWTVHSIGGVGCSAGGNSVGRASISGTFSTTGNLNEKSYSGGYDFTFVDYGTCFSRVNGQMFSNL